MADSQDTDTPRKENQGESNEGSHSQTSSGENAAADGKEEANNDIGDEDSEHGSGSADKPKPKKEEVKPLIPDDFYYEKGDLTSRPFKSDESLPDDLLILYHSFGYASQARQNLHALDERRLIFAAGAYLQIVHIGVADGVRYQFLPTYGGGSVGAIAVHPAGDLFAVGEKGVNPNVNIFTVSDYRMYRILRGGTTVQYTSLAFNCKGDLLATQGGDPDFMLTVWNWQQEAILLRCKSFSQEVGHVSFNRDLEGALTTAGSGHIKFWNMARTFTGLKLQGSVGRFGRTALSDVEGYIEFPDGKVLSGCDWGNLLLWDENLIKIQITRKKGKPCHVGRVMHMVLVDGEIMTVGTDGFVRCWNLEQIDSLESGEESGTVELEPMNEYLVFAGAHLYYLTRPRRECTRVPSNLTNTSGDVHGGDADEASWWFCQSASGGVWQADLSFRNNAAPAKKLLHFHSGAIVACAVSPVSHLAMTLGEDGTLRLYDFLSKQLLAIKEFKANGSALVWIPLGVDNKCSSVMAGFSDGGIRRIVIDNSVTTTFGVRSQGCSLKLMDAIKPHDQAVTSVAYSCHSRSGKGSGHQSLVTSSLDMTLFFFDVSGTTYNPLFFVPLLHVPRRVIWSPEPATQDHLMIVCDGGHIIEMQEPVGVDHTETYKWDRALMRVYKFPSCKSQIQHDIEVEQAEEAERIRAEERDTQNKMLLLKHVETSSQQDLRISMENAATEAAIKEKEEKEGPWTPYIPAVPSPILQTVYFEGDSRFWLTLGDYDAGFLYECQFTQSLAQWGGQAGAALMPPVLDVTPPVRAIPVLDAETTAITALCFNSDGTCVFLGMQDGRIRLQFLESEYDLSRERCHWSVGAHDVTHGALTSLTLSHDEAFLLTVGEDGNFFVFSLVPLEQLKEEMSSLTAKIPSDKIEDTGIVDLSPSEYTIEKAKSKKDQDMMEALAMKAKLERRVEIGALRVKFKSAMIQNNALPYHHRLASNEFVMDPRRRKENELVKEKKVERVYYQTAWDTEKIRLECEKLYNFYLEPVNMQHFKVCAIQSPHAINSYISEKLGILEPMISPTVSRPITPPCEAVFVVIMNLNGVSPNPHAVLHEYTPYCRVSVFIMTLNDVNTSWSAEANEREMRLLLGEPIDSDIYLGMNSRTVYLLKKVEEKRVKRARRKLAWNRFMETMPGDDVVDPECVHAISEAYRTMGGRNLKADSDYLVPDSYKLTLADGAKRMRECRKILTEKRIKFNGRLLELRDRKVETIHEVSALLNRLNLVREQIDSSLWLPYPEPAVLRRDEQVGWKFEVCPAVEKHLREEARLTTRAKALVEVREGRAAAYARQDTIFHKSFRRGSGVMSKESVDKHSVNSVNRSTGSMASLSIDDSKGGPGLSVMEFESKEARKALLVHEQKTIIKLIENRKTLFDTHHRLLRHKKYLLDVMVHVGHLRHTTLIQEQLVLRGCQSVELEIEGRILSALKLKVEAESAVKHLQALGAKHTREMEECTGREKKLFARLDGIIGDANFFRDYLVKVFKRKVKRKLTSTSKSDSEDSDSSSEDDDDDDDSDVSGDDEGIHLDLGICPPDCDQEIYNSVVKLREERLDLDEATQEAKRNKDQVTKDLECLVKRRLAVDSTCLKAEEELEDFQREKQKRMNELEVLCTVNLHQIQCVKSSGLFTDITDEMLVNETEVNRLGTRIQELKDEKTREKQKMIARRKQHARLIYERRLFLDELDIFGKKCDREMTSKLGRIVDLEVVEGVSADPKLEDMRARLTQHHIQCDKEELCQDRRMQRLKLDNNQSLKVDTLYKHLQAGMSVSKRQLGRHLDHRVTKGNNMSADDAMTSMGGLPRDCVGLSEVVQAQRVTIDALVQEMSFLLGDMPDA